jgi:hypothetical protein
MSMIYVLALLPVAPIACGVYLVHRALKTWVTECWRSLAAVVDTYQGLMALRSAHDNHVEVVDRRMRGVEEAAARAEREARLVSIQLADVAQELTRQTTMLREIRAQVAELAGSEGLPAAPTRSSAQLRVAAGEWPAARDLS